MKRDVIVWGGIGEKKSNQGTQWYLQNRIYNIEGLSPALTQMKSDYWINMTNKDLIVDKVKLPVFKRKYPVDVEGLQKLLHKHKKGLSNKIIADKLDIPETTVAHWFRTDKYFSIPSKEVWFDLKELLGINDVSFDKQITEFEEVEGVYDMSNRVYSDEGLAPTLKCQNNGELIKEHNKDLYCINPWKHQAQRVYTVDGVATTLSANGGGQGGKTGLYLVDNMNKKVIEKNFKKVDENRLMTTTKDGNSLAITTTRPSRPVGKKLTNFVLEKKDSMKQVIEDNFTEVEEGKYVTTDRERNGCYAITTGPRSTSLHKKIDNHVLEECIGSTQRNAARTDGSESPTLTEAMGKGGGHVPMLKLRESTSKGFKEAKEGDGVELSRSHCSVRRGVSHEDATGALNCQEGSWGTVTNDYRIRKLTPRECERLQGFPDDWTKYGENDELISDTQRYKCCGNAVTTNVITAIVDEMFEGIDEN